MEEVPIENSKGETIEINYFEPITIEQDKKTYILNIDVNEDILTLSIKDKDYFLLDNYSRNMNLKEIKELNKVFNSLNSLNDFYVYLKVLSNEDKISIKNINNDSISMIFHIENQLNLQDVEIVLNQTQIDIKLHLKEIYNELINIKDKIKEIDKIKEENINLNNENNDLKRKIDDNINLINQVKNENKDLRKKIEELKKEIDNLKVNLIVEQFENLISKIINKEVYGEYKLKALEKISQKLITNNVSSLEYLNIYFTNFEKSELNQIDNEKKEIYLEKKENLYNFAYEIDFKFNNKIEKFRKKFMILKEYVTDEEIKKYLRKNNNNELKAYEELLNSL